MVHVTIGRGSVATDHFGDLNEMVSHAQAAPARQSFRPTIRCRCTSDWLDANLLATLTIDVVTQADLVQRITVRPEQCGGRPCIRGMRVRVIDVLELLAAGESHEQILADFPYLEADDIAACLLYAARRLDHPNIAA
jgi:uncharacterized protein (DUF433 family)